MRASGNKIWVCGCLIVCAHFSFAQELNCDQLLIKSENEMKEGHFYYISSALTHCLNNKNYSIDQSLRAYILMVQAYLILGNQKAAEKNYIKLLKISPEFTPNLKENSVDLVYFSRMFSTIPIFVPKFRFGINNTYFKSIYSVNVDPYPVLESKSGIIGIQGGIGIDWNFYPKLAVGVESNFAIWGHRRNRSQIAGKDIQKTNSNLYWFNFPLYLKYSKINGKVRPFVYAGISLDYLINIRSSFSYFDKKDGVVNSFIEGPSESINFQSSQLNYSWFVGSGIKLKLSKNYIYLDVRYMSGISLISNNMMYYSDVNSLSTEPVGNPNYILNPNITQYRYLSDYYKLDNLSFSVGFSRPIYVARKAKKGKGRIRTDKTNPKNGK